ncbi:hypothetical protein KPH14_006646 [Odynerus spinipes]|uniref:Uncharacterized protein n=1 Tax=Odynerus spinipes TaxID=1348599 RepID=A0AAD9RR09_9HYME|nr:hypothetical protein KPH14_006646 [Odynerus spinipes]
MDVIRNTCACKGTCNDFMGFMIFLEKNCIYKDVFDEGHPFPTPFYLAYKMLIKAFLFLPSNIWSEGTSAKEVILTKANWCTKKTIFRIDNL